MFQRGGFKSSSVPQPSRQASNIPTPTLSTARSPPCAKCGKSHPRSCWIPMKGLNVIIGVDWLMANNATLDCARKIVLLPVYAAPANIPSKSKFLSVVQVKKLMQQGYMAYMVFFSVHGVYDRSIDKIRVVNELPEVFMDDMSGLPPEREVEFT
ncbi:uncharacterized protein LOC129297836 [Prosopis cineraria]|uniref:uncharacterized protein LOC129297836 n=1 Tax=Prosopis cineraria TaxID=364024 RepID=UPI00240F852A|nr:uncharacterized protein LOC129297836 [Prosopis cineraria]